MKANTKARVLAPIEEKEIAWAWTFVAFFALCGYFGGRVSRGELLALTLWPFIVAVVLFTSRIIKEVCRGTQ